MDLPQERRQRDYGRNHSPGYEPPGIQNPSLRREQKPCQQCSSEEQNAIFVLDGHSHQHADRNQSRGFAPLVKRTTHNAMSGQDQRPTMSGETFIPKSVKTGRKKTTIADRT